MQYSFRVKKNEDNMVNYFKNTSGLDIKDTLIVTLQNTGTSGWMPFKGSFKCLEQKSNLFFDEVLIPQEVYPNKYVELVLNFSRIEKNTNYGNCFTTLQLIYKNQVYNDVTIHFTKNFNLSGNSVVKEGQVEREEGGEVNYLKPGKIKEEIEEKILKEEEKEKKDDGHAIIIKFRSAFQFSKVEYPDEYLKGLLDKAKNDFQAAMMLHLDNEDKKKEDNKQKVKSEEGLNSLVEQFRKEYQLSPEDYSDEIIKKALIKKEGDFNNTFEELMSFIA